MAEDSSIAMDFVDRFYRLLDGQTPEALDEYAELFDDDAEFVTPVTTVTGKEAIKAQRDEFWAQFPSLTHQPARVYVSPFSPLDIVVINNYEFTAKDGSHHLSWTAAEYKLVEHNGGHIIQRLEIFMDPTVLGWK
ncbi:hypothetical protein BDV19DRAFT_371452 [Aspergillus venezuelensis]